MSFISASRMFCRECTKRPKQGEKNRKRLGDIATHGLKLVFSSISLCRSSHSHEAKRTSTFAKLFVFSQSSSLKLRLHWPFLQMQNGFCRQHNQKIRERRFKPGTKANKRSERSTAKPYTQTQTLVGGQKRTQTKVQPRTKSERTTVDKGGQSANTEPMVDTWRAKPGGGGREMR